MAPFRPVVAITVAIASLVAPASAPAQPAADGERTAIIVHLEGLATDN